MSEASRLPEGAFPPGTVLRRGDASKLTIGRLLNDGAEGFIYELSNDSDLAFKHCNKARLIREPELEPRLKAMINSPPERWREPRSGHVLLTWPIDTVFDDQTCVGYVMPRIDAASAAEIHILSNPSDRRKPSHETPGWVQGFTWDYLLQTAANLALATDVLHNSGCVFGDFNDRNILVTSRARVTLVDCDSMQIANPHGGDFLCQVGRPDFTAPELIWTDGGSTSRAPSSDLFPLAVHVHLLLLEGVHPFDGLWDGRDEKPKRLPLATKGLYVYSGNHRLKPHPLWMNFGLVPKPVQDLFRRAFINGARDPSQRPTGAEWHATLDETRSTLRKCKHVATHIYPGHLKSCPWCEQNARVHAATNVAQRRLRTLANSPGTTHPPRSFQGPPRVGLPRRLNRPAIWIGVILSLVAVGIVIEALKGSGASSPPIETQNSSQAHAHSTPSSGQSQTHSANADTASQTSSRPTASTNANNTRPPGHHVSPRHSTASRPANNTQRSGPTPPPRAGSTPPPLEGHSGGGSTQTGGGASLEGQTKEHPAPESKGGGLEGTSGGSGGGSGGEGGLSGKSVE